MKLKFTNEGREVKFEGTIYEMAELLEAAKQLNLAWNNLTGTDKDWIKMVMNMTGVNL